MFSLILFLGPSLTLRRFSLRRGSLLTVRREPSQGRVFLAVLIESFEGAFVVKASVTQYEWPITARLASVARAHESNISRSR